MGNIKNMYILEDSKYLYVQFYQKAFMCLKIRMNIKLVSQTREVYEFPPVNKEICACMYS